MRGEQTRFQEQSDIDVVTSEAGVAILQGRNSQPLDICHSSPVQPWNAYTTWPDRCYHRNPGVLANSDVRSEQGGRFVHVLNDSSLTLPIQGAYTSHRNSSITGLCLVPDVHRISTSPGPAPEKYKESHTWPIQRIYLAPALRGLGSHYSLPRPHLRQRDEAEEEEDLERSPRASEEGSFPVCLEEADRLPTQPLRFTKEQLWRERLKEKERQVSYLSASASPYLATYSPTLPSCPSCSCCLSTLRANSVVDPSSPWAFTIVSPVKKKKKRCCRNWWLLLVLFSCFLALVMGLLYICQVTHAMDHGVTEY